MSQPSDITTADRTVFTAEKEDAGETLTGVMSPPVVNSSTTSNLVPADLTMTRSEVTKNTEQLDLLEPATGNGCDIPEHNSLIKTEEESNVEEPTPKVQLKVHDQQKCCTDTELQPVKQIVNTVPKMVTCHGTGRCGLINLGNTCFMNSALQCMSNTEPLRKYFLQSCDGSISYKDHINRSNPHGMGGAIAEAFGDLLQEMWSGTNHLTAPREFKTQIGKFSPTFAGYQQQDSQELMNFLLDGLHEDLNLVKKKPYVDLMEDDRSKTDEEMAEESWFKHLQRHQSVIVKLFQGQLMARNVCRRRNCNKVSRIFDPFTFLSLPLPTMKTVINVTVVRSWSFKPAVEYKVMVSNNTTVHELKQELLKLTGISTEKMAIVHVWLNWGSYYTYTVYKDEQLIPNQPGAQLFTLELAELNQELERHVIIFHKDQRQHKKFGTPVVVKLPLTCLHSDNDLYKAVSEILSPQSQNEPLTHEAANTKTLADDTKPTTSFGSDQSDSNQNCYSNQNTIQTTVNRFAKVRPTSIGDSNESHFTSGQVEGNLEAVATDNPHPNIDSDTPEGGHNNNFVHHTLEEKSKEQRIVPSKDKLQSDSGPGVVTFMDDNGDHCTQSKGEEKAELAGDHLSNEIVMQKDEETAMGYNNANAEQDTEDVTQNSEQVHAEVTDLKSMDSDKFSDPSHPTSTHSEKAIFEQTGDEIQKKIIPDRDQDLTDENTGTQTSSEENEGESLGRRDKDTPVTGDKVQSDPGTDNQNEDITCIDDVEDHSTQNEAEGHTTVTEAPSNVMQGVEDTEICDNNEASPEQNTEDAMITTGTSDNGGNEQAHTEEHATQVQQHVDNDQSNEGTQPSEGNGDETKTMERDTSVTGDEVQSVDTQNEEITHIDEVEDHSTQNEANGDTKVTEDSVLNVKQGVEDVILGLAEICGKDEASPEQWTGESDAVTATDTSDNEQAYTEEHAKHVDNNRSNKDTQPSEENGDESKTMEKDTTPVTGDKVQGDPGVDNQNEETTRINGVEDHSTQNEAKGDTKVTEDSILNVKQGVEDKICGKDEASPEQWTEESDAVTATDTGDNEQAYTEEHATHVDIDKSDKDIQPGEENGDESKNMEKDTTPVTGEKLQGDPGVDNQNEETTHIDEVEDHNTQNQAEGDITVTEDSISNTKHGSNEEHYTIPVSDVQEPNPEHDAHVDQSDNKIIRDSQHTKNDEGTEDHMHPELPCNDKTRAVNLSVANNTQGHIEGKHGTEINGTQYQEGASYNKSRAGTQATARFPNRQYAFHLSLIMPTDNTTQAHKSELRKEPDQKLILLTCNWHSPHSVPLPNVVKHTQIQRNNTRHVDLKDCLTLMSNESTLDNWYCTGECKTLVSVSRTFKLWKLPPVLIVHLKRFSYDGSGRRQKLTTFVHFPIKNLELGEFMANAKDLNPVYDLFAVCNHTGTVYGGHYTAYVKTQNNSDKKEKWMKFDDTRISEIKDSRHLVTPAAYVLFYSRRDHAVDVTHIKESIAEEVKRLAKKYGPQQDQATPVGQDGSNECNNNECNSAKDHDADETENEARCPHLDDSNELWDEDSKCTNV